jgi:hypothetical protein
VLKRLVGHLNESSHLGESRRIKVLKNCCSASFWEDGCDLWDGHLDIFAVGPMVNLTSCGIIDQLSQ